MKIALTAAMDSQDGISIASGESNSSFAPTNKRVAISEAFEYVLLNVDKFVCAKNQRANSNAVCAAN